jgi:hypothetical protein
MAGTGKSTISRIVAKLLGYSLGASFFFKTGEGIRGGNKIPASMPGFKKQLMQTLTDITNTRGAV